MDLIRFHYVAALIMKQSEFIERPNHIKLSSHFFPQTHGAQSFSPVIPRANYLCSSVARYNTLSRLVLNAAVCIFVDFFCRSCSYVRSNSLSIGLYCPKAIFLRNKKPALIFFSCLPFSRNTLETYLAPLECLYIIIKVKSRI